MQRLRTSIAAELQRGRLLLGSAIAAPGILLMIWASFLSPQLLARWGVVFALLSILLIALGLIPYRRICRLQLHPNQIALEEENLTYVIGETPRFRLSKEGVREIAFLKERGGYGIGLWLHLPIEKKITVIDPRFDMQKFMNQSRRRGCDLYLPLFSERAAAEIEEWLQNSRLNQVVHFDQPFDP